ncbi:MAG: rhodanese-like domain-containing protein, partial [Promethearchaeota archaeon]
AYAELNEAIKLLSLKKEEGKLVATLAKGELTAKELEIPLKTKKLSRKELKGLGAPPLSDITVDELYDRLNSGDSPAILIDVRTPQEYNNPGGHIKNTKLMPLGEFMYNLDSLKEYKEKEIVLICHSGSRSMMASQLLVRAGFKDVRNLTGGMVMWHKKGYPVEGAVKY